MAIFYKEKRPRTEAAVIMPERRNLEKCFYPV